jgi:hypothetical protein
VEGEGVKRLFAVDAANPRSFTEVEIPFN